MVCPALGIHDIVRVQDGHNIGTRRSVKGGSTAWGVRERAQDEVYAGAQRLVSGLLDNLHSIDGQEDFLAHAHQNSVLDRQRICRKTI